MCSWRSAAAAATLCAAVCAHAQQAYPGIGRPATAKEIAAWDIDVRPDFKGLPAGKGSVKQGEELWEAKCASCHGSFGESNAVFPPIAGTRSVDHASYPRRHDASGVPTPPFQRTQHPRRFQGRK